MKNLFLFITLVIITAISFTSCDKDREGCTDPTALNFDQFAVVDDGSCIEDTNSLIDPVITLFGNGQFGFFGDTLTGSVYATSCFTNSSTVLLNPDSTFLPNDTTITPPDTTFIPEMTNITPADTVITPADTTFIIFPPDTIITPADTMITPADTVTVPADTIISAADTVITPGDTLITGDLKLLASSNDDGNFLLLLKILNKKNALNFNDGNLVFKAKLHPEGVNLSQFSVFIDGGNFNGGTGDCPNFLRSGYVNLSTSVLDTSSYREISVPIADFTVRHLENLELVFGVRGSGAPNSNLILIEEVKYVK